MDIIDFIFVCIFFFQAEDGIRDLVRSRGLGDVYKRQIDEPGVEYWEWTVSSGSVSGGTPGSGGPGTVIILSLIHI